MIPTGISLLREALAREPVKGVMAEGKVTGWKPSWPLRCRGLADHRHAFRHVEGEFRHTGGVVAGDNVGVAPRPVHVGRAHPEGSAVDQHSTPPAFFDTLGEFRQPALKLVRRHVCSGIEPTQLDQVRGGAVEYLSPSVFVQLLSHGDTS